MKRIIKIYNFVFINRSTFHRLVETADIISHLAKNTKSSSAKIKKPIVQQTPIIEGSASASTTKIQKFRTSSYVATAVVPSRRHRKSLTLQTPPLTLPSSAQPKQPNNNDQNTDSEPENIKIPLRRTRSKSLKFFREVAGRKCEKLS